MRESDAGQAVVIGSLALEAGEDRPVRGNGPEGPRRRHASRFPWGRSAGSRRVAARTNVHRLRQRSQGTRKPRLTSAAVPASLDIIAEIAVRLPRWHLAAECRGEDPTIFFPEPGQSTTEARAYCVRCPVITERLEEAIDDGLDYGYRGGMAPRERQRLVRQRGRQPEPSESVFAV